MRLGLIMAAMLTLCTTMVHAAPTNSTVGCGWGSILFDGNKKKSRLILAATTNGTSGNQTFGVSSETMGCTSEGGWVKTERKVEVYTAANFERISKDMAQGGGEYLTGLSTLMGCKDEKTRKAFFEMSQKKYEKIIPSEKTDSVAMLRNLKSEMAVDPVLQNL